MGLQSFQVQRVAVVGSGTMGGGIAALLAGVGIPVTILDITPNELTQKEIKSGLTLEASVVRNRIVCENMLQLKNTRPPALYSQGDMELISTGNLDDDFDELAAVDWVIEAIIEDLDAKRAYLQNVAFT